MTIEILKAEIVSTANFLRGMLFDPSIPLNVKQALLDKINELDTLAKQWGET